MNDPDFIAHCLELLAPAGAPRAKRMFGGHGIYLDELFVALVIRDVLYLKADDGTRPVFEAAGGHPFTYQGSQGEVGVLSFWTVPEEAMESPREMVPWARHAIAAAVAARGKKAARKRAPAAKVVAKKVVAKKVVTKKAVARKAAARKAPSRAKEGA